MALTVSAREMFKFLKFGEECFLFRSTLLGSNLELLTQNFWGLLSVAIQRSSELELPSDSIRMFDVPIDCRSALISCQFTLLTKPRSSELASKFKKKLSLFHLQLSSWFFEQSALWPLSSIRFSLRISNVLRQARKNLAFHYGH